MKMKVRVDKLKRAIEKYVEKDKARFAKETEQFADRQERARERYIENVKAYLVRMQNGGTMIESYELSNYLQRGCNFPSAPKEANTHVDLLVKLDLAEDQILVVDDHSDYMRFLSGKCVCR